MNGARGRGVLIAGMLVAALWLATLAADRTPAPKPLDAPPTEFSGARAKLMLQRLVGDSVPHPLGSVANARVREHIVAALTDIGLTPQLQSPVMVCSDDDGVCGVPTNILARIQGTDATSEQAVLLAAHYDSVAAGPGASDNGVGVAAVLEIARILTLRPRTRQSIILLFEDGEEPGLLGAHAFVQHHPWAATVSAAVNLDARGTSGPSLMFETGSANRWLMRLYASAIARPLTNSVYYAVYKLLPNDTDFTVFKAAGYQGFNFAFIGDVAHYHTPLDDVLHADGGSMQHQGSNALSTLLALANAGPEPKPSGEAVYFDLFGRLLIQFPQPWASPLALIGLLLIALAGARLLQLQLLSVRTFGWGILSLGAAVVASAIAAAALMALLRALGAGAAGGADAAVAHPWALELSFAALAFCIAACIGARAQRRAGFWGLWYPGTLLYALLAVALARWLPGASYLALLPVAVALLALIPVMLPYMSRRAPSAWLTSAELAGLAVCAVTFVLVLPIALPLYSALGGTGLPLLTLLLIYGSFSLAALVALSGSRAQRGLIMASALATLIGLTSAWLLPRHTEESPQRLNLRYDLDADTQSARWIADPLSGDVPAPLLHVAPFARSAQQAGARSEPLWAAVAPLLPMAAPQLNILSAEREPQRVRYRLHVSSVRAAPVLALAFPPEAGVRSVVLQSAVAPPLAVAPRQRRNGWLQLRLWGLPSEGQDLSFDAADTPFEIRLLDESFGLPVQGLSLQRSRPSVAAPTQDGDVTIVMRSYHLQPG